MLSKQSLRKGTNVYLNRELAGKELLIELSKEWTESEEILFRKVLKQGGNFKIQGHSYKVVIEDKLLNSRGNLDAPIKPNSHKGDEVDPNYIRR